MHLCVCVYECSCIADMCICKEIQVDVYECTCFVYVCIYVCITVVCTIV